MHQLENNNVSQPLENEKILKNNFKKTRFQKITEIIKVSLKKTGKVLLYAKIPVFFGFLRETLLY